MGLLCRRSPNLFCHSAFCIYAHYFSCTRKGSSEFQFISLMFQGHFWSLILSFQMPFSFPVPICVICKYADFREILNASHCWIPMWLLKYHLLWIHRYLCPFARTSPSAWTIFQYTHLPFPPRDFLIQGSPPLWGLSPSLTNHTFFFNLLL